MHFLSQQAVFWAKSWKWANPSFPSKSWCLSFLSKFHEKVKFLNFSYLADTHTQTDRQTHRGQNLQAGPPLTQEICIPCAGYAPPHSNILHIFIRITYIWHIYYIYFTLYIYILHIYIYIYYIYYIYIYIHYIYLLR